MQLRAWHARQPQSTHYTVAASLDVHASQEGKTAVKASLDRAEALKRGIAGLEREIGLLRGAYARRACAGRGL